MKDYDYSKEDIVKALRSAGVEKGDSIFSHSNIGFFGKLKDAKTAEDYYKAFKEVIFEVIGEEGTLVVPTFSYSFCKNKSFDAKNTPGVCGLFSEMVRKDKNSVRSADANFSIAAIGKNAEYFTKDTTFHSFGKGCFWERFLKKDGKFCNFNFDSGSTFIHYVEKCLGVPYRYDKGFSGKLLENGKEIECEFIHFVYDLNNPEHVPDFTKLDKRAKELGFSKVANLGKGTILRISAKDKFKLISEEIKKVPNFLIKGRI